MSIDIVRRLENGVWTTEMVPSGGGGGGGGDSFADPVEVAPSDPNDPAPLLNVTAPANYQNVSENGTMISTQTADGDVVFATDVWGDIYITAPPGQGPGTILVQGADYDGKRVEINSNVGIRIICTGGGITVESDNRTSFVFRATPDPDIPTMGFFGATAPRQPLPVTLQDVIDTLVAYGLVVAP
jgi:hypothetical protein